MSFNPISGTNQRPLDYTISIPRDFVHTSPSNATTSTLSSTSAPINARDRKIEGIELIVKSVMALSIGFVPFTTSKAGELIVKTCAWTARTVRDASDNRIYGVVAVVLRAMLGVPAVLGGTLLFGGAKIFSKSQALVWGQELVKHPQEERPNTQLARYGAGEKPLQDFKKLLSAFFRPFDLPRTESSDDGQGEAQMGVFTDTDISNDLLKLQKFEAN